MIRIEEGERLYWTLDDVLAHKLNNSRVRVRMLTKDTNHIYLFEQYTDTYLGCLTKELETAGDIANATAEDWKRIRSFVDKKNGSKKYREDLLKEAEDCIEQENSLAMSNELPTTLLESGRLIITEDERKRRVTYLAKENHEVQMPTPNITLTEEKRELDIAIVNVELIDLTRESEVEIRHELSDPVLDNIDSYTVVLEHISEEENLDNKSSINLEIAE